MRLTETISNTPIPVRKSIREDYIRTLTSGPCGKIVPICYAPLLREDRVSNANLRVRVEMMETAELLVNAVNVTVHAWFVPFLASERFNGLDQFNRSWSGEPESEGGEWIPFVPAYTFNPADAVPKTMGFHAVPDEAIGGWPIEAYNLVVNHRRKSRSKNITLRSAMDTTLAEAFWPANQFDNVVPDFDQALIAGEIPITGLASLSGIGVLNANLAGGNAARTGVWETGATASRNYTTGKLASDATGGVVIETDATGKPLIFAEMESAGVYITLANIEMARETQAFAKMREKYSGIDDEYIIDLLMDGIRVPEQELRNPLLLDRKQTLMGYNRRYATDAENLTESVANGETFVDLRFRTPAFNTGGIIMVTMEVVPEMLWERQRDEFWRMSPPTIPANAGQIPNYTRDYLDPEKIIGTVNGVVDVRHSDPNGTFGYRPLNSNWRRRYVRIGGKFYRNDPVAPFNEDRQRIWAAETIDPTLTEDFYLVSELPTTIFVDSISDPLEINARGSIQIVGNTVFGDDLDEDVEAWQETLEDVNRDQMPDPSPTYAAPKQLAGKAE